MFMRLSALYLLATVAADLNLFGTSFLPNPSKLVNYAGTDGKALLGYLVTPILASKFNKKPAVIIFHAFTGRGEFDNQKARDIADMGYVAFAADTYGKDWTFNGVADLNKAFGMMGSILGNRTEILKPRIMAAWNYVNQLDFVDKNNIGSIGFCYGGLCSLDLARYDVGAKAVVPFHADLTNLPSNTNNLANRTRTSIQAHHGDADLFTTHQNAEDFLNEMRARNADWQFNIYGGAEHAFTMPGVNAFNLTGASYDATATARAWAGMTTFLKERFNC